MGRRQSRHFDAYSAVSQKGRDQLGSVLCHQPQQSILVLMVVSVLVAMLGAFRPSLFLVSVAR